MRLCICLSHTISEILETVIERATRMSSLAIKRDCCLVFMDINEENPTTLTSSWKSYNSSRCALGQRRKETL